MDNKLKNKKGNWNLESIAINCAEELRKADIPVQYILETKIIRDRYLFGRVSETYADRYITLYISNAYRSPKYELAEVKTVICHLLLHSIEGCMNHGKKWREYAEKADRECGLSIIKQYASRTGISGNWDDEGANAISHLNRERCCFADYVEKLEELAGICSEELKGIGLNTGHVSGLLFLNDKTAFGRCRKNGDHDFTIMVSEEYAGNDADRFGLKGLLCHELLHTCPEDDSDNSTNIHGPKWREMARMVEKECGYKIMAQSHTDAIKKTTNTPKKRLLCPVCGGYYDVYEKDDEFGRETLNCKWCKNKMNVIKTEDMGFLDTIYIMLGEYQDKMRIAGIPIRKLSGIGFVSMDKSTGLHNNWNGSFSIDLPEKFRKQEMLNSNELKAYMCRELVKSCGECDDSDAKWDEYIQKAERILGFSLLSSQGYETEIQEVKQITDKSLLKMEIKQEEYILRK